MATVYPLPGDLGVRVPCNLIEERFNSGFQHALRGGQINRPDHLRLSFREGFRLGKRYLRYLRRKQGIHEFPMKAQMRLRAYN